MTSKIMVILVGEENAHVHEGDKEVAFGPEGSIMINDMIPDVGNINEGKPTAKPKVIYNANVWHSVVLGDTSE